MDDDNDDRDSTHATVAVAIDRGDNRRGGWKRRQSRVVVEEIAVMEAEITEEAMIVINGDHTRTLDDEAVMPAEEANQRRRQRPMLPPAS